MQKSFKRSTQLNKVIQRELSLILRNKLNLHYAVIHSVALSADLAAASVYINCLNIEDHQHDVVQTVDMLNEQSKSIRYALSQYLNMRRTPSLQFFVDKNTQHARTIDNLLEKNR